MPREITFHEAFGWIQAALQDQAGEVGVRFDGLVTYMIDIRNFYVVPLSRYKLLHFMEKPGSLMLDYVVNSVVMYNSPIIKRCVRGKVNAVNPDKSCDIHSMDYGIADTGVTPEKIFYLLHRELEMVPGFALLCELSMCYPLEGPEFTSEAQQAFKYFMGQKAELLRFTVMEKNDQKSSVLVMSSNSSPDDVSTALSYGNHTKLYAAPI